MKTSLISAALALLLANVSAAPTAAKKDARQFEALITFQGADPTVSFTQSVPTTPDSSFTINNPLSVTKISSEGGASCVFFGRDGSRTEVIGAMTSVVAPPQPQVSGTCVAF